MPKIINAIFLFCLLFFAYLTTINSIRMLKSRTSKAQSESTLKLVNQAGAETKEVMKTSVLSKFLKKVGVRSYSNINNS